MRMGSPTDEHGVSRGLLAGRQLGLSRSHDHIMQVDILPMRSPRVNGFENPLALQEAFKTNGHIKSTVKRLRLRRTGTREISPATHKEADNVTVGNVSARQMIAANIAESDCNLWHVSSPQTILSCTPKMDIAIPPTSKVADQ